MDHPIDILIALSAGIAVGCGVWLAFGFAGRVREEFAEGDERFAGELYHRLPLPMRLLRFLGRPFRLMAASPKTEETRKRIELRLWMAGYGESVPAADFLGIRIAAVFLGLLWLAVLLLAGRPLPALLGLFICLYPDFWLTRTIRRRHTSILKALPNVLDLLTLSVEAGKDFMSSLRDILARRKLDPLGEELERGLREIQLGKKRSQALRNIAERTRQEDLTTVLNSVIQAEELGVSIGQMLRIQSDMLRNKRFARAEKQANEAPVKLLVPLFVFIFPSVLIILATALISEVINMF